MTSIAANAQATVTLTPGQQMTVKGRGMAVYGPGPLNAQPSTILNVATFGPFPDRSQSITLSADASGLTYNVFNAASVPAQATVNSSGASDGGLQSPDGSPLIQVPPQPDLPTLIANYPAASNAGKTAMAGGLPFESNGTTWELKRPPVNVASRAIIGILGQSNEGGLTAESRTDTTKVWYNAPSQGYFESQDKLNFAGNGSMFTVMAEELAKAGVSVRLVNGSMGGASMLSQMCGVARAWAASTRYAAERTSLGNGDPGYRGDHIISSGKWFKATAGARNMAFLNEGAGVSWNGGTQYNMSAFSQETLGVSAGKVSGGTVPAGFATANVGDTVTDNQVTWQCVSTTHSTTMDNGLHVIRYWEPGFDPYFALDRLSKALFAVNGSYGNRYVIVQNGQSDPNILTSWYSVALREIGRYFLARGVIPVFGLSVPMVTSSYQNNESVVFGGTGLIADAQDPDNVGGLTYCITNFFNQATATSGTNPPFDIPSYGLPGIPGTASTGARPKLWYHGVSLYRLEGGQYPANTPNLQSDNLHAVRALADRCGLYWADRMRKIIKDVAV